MGRKTGSHRRWIVAASAIVLLGVLVPSSGLWDTPAVDAAPPHLSPDTQGEITEWMLILPREEQLLFLPSQAAIVASAQANARFRIVHEDDGSRERFERELKRLSFLGWDRLTWVRDEGPLPPWARDMFVMGEDVGGAPICFLHHPGHYEVMTKVRTRAGSTQRAVERVVGSPVLQTQARLEGGCLVVDEHTVFVSRRNLDLLVQSGDVADFDEARAYFADLYGQRVIDLPAPSTRPDEHCDLHLTSLGHGRVLLADPAWGRELLERMTLRERQVFQTRLKVLSRATSPDHTLPSLRRRDLYAELVADMRDTTLETTFDQIEGRLRAQGFQVFRVPWVATDMRRRAEPTPVFSWNNVVLEDGPNGGIAYVPAYGLPPLDAAAARVFRALGYEVRPIPALGPALRRGAVRCLTQTVRAPVPGT